MPGLFDKLDNQMKKNEGGVFAALEKRDKEATKAITPKSLTKLLQTTPETVKEQPKQEIKLTPAQKKVYAEELKPIEPATKTVITGKGVKKEVKPQGKLAPKNLERPDNPFAPALVNFANTASLGLLERNTDAIDQLRQNAPISSTVGSMAGYLAPFSAAKGAVVKGAQTVGKRIATDAAIGAGLDTANELIKGKNDVGTAAKNIAAGAAIGIVADGALEGLGLIGKAIKAKLNNAAKGIIEPLTDAELSAVNNLPQEAKQEILQLPSADRLLLPERTTSVIELPGPAKVQYPEPQSFKTMQNAIPKLSNEEKQFTNAIKKSGFTVDDFIEEAQAQIKQIEDDHLQYLRNSMGQGVEQGGIYRDDMGRVIGRQGRISNNPGWYKDFYSLNGRRPTVAEMKELTKQHLTEGFDDTLSSIPANDEYIRLKSELSKYEALKNEQGKVLKPNKPIQPNLEKRTIKPNPDYFYGTTPELNNPLKVPEQYKRETPFTVFKASENAVKTLDNINTPPIENKVLKSPLKALDEAATTVENADSFMAKINVKPTKKKGDLSLKLKTDLVDRLAPLEKVEKAIRGKIDSAEKSLYKTARNYFGTPEKAHEVVRTQLEPVLKEAERQGFNVNELAAYAEAVHAKDVNAAGIKSGFTDKEIADTINKYKGLEPLRLELQKVNNFVLDELVNNEVISKQSADAMRNKWKNYMPLFRNLEDDKVEFGKGLSQTFANVGSPIKTLKGSDKQVIDPIESMIKNIFQGINTAERNKVGLQLSQLAKEDIDGTFIRKLADTEQVGRKNVLNIKEAGQNVKYEVHPELYKAMLNLDKESSTMLINILSKPASALRAGATLTVEFAARNPMRDVLNAYITSKSGFNPFTDFARGLASTLKKDDYYHKFIMSNGAYGESMSMDRNMHREILERALKNPGKQFVDVVSGKSLIRLLRAISDTTEKATKVGEFRKALKQGQTMEEAAYRARDLMDFARAGNSVKEANKVIAFLNANIQGKSKFIRAIKEDPLGVSVRIGKAVALPSVAVFTLQQTMANDEQKAIIQDAPDWLRDTFWLVPIPGTNQVARIPKPFDFAVFGNTLERFLAYTVNNDKEAFDNFARSTLKQQSIPVMMTGIVPIIEGMTNYSFFRDAPIIPQREANLQRSDQFDTYTSELSKVIAKGLTPVFGEESNFTSPRIVDNTIRGVTAGLGGYALDIFDIILGKETQKPSKNISQFPVLKGFLVNENSTGKSMDMVYTDRDKLTKEKNSSKLNQLPFTQQKELKKATNTADQVSALTKKIREVTNSKTLSPEQKRLEINRLSDLRNKLTREYKQGK